MIKEIAMECGVDNTKEVEINRIDEEVLNIAKNNIKNQLKAKYKPQYFKILDTYYSISKGNFYGTVIFYKEGE